jgi:hypothetical protein
MADESVVVPLATADVQMVPGCVLFLRGPIIAGADSIAPVWSELLHTAGHGRKVRYRRGARAEWILWADKQAEPCRLFDSAQADAGCRRIEFILGEGASAITFELTDLMPVLGEERASYIRVNFPVGTPPLGMVRLAESALRTVPLHWGSIGITFAHVSGPRHIAYKRIAALAKRHWGVQIQDLSTLQWDATRGMPGVNWLTLIGNEFASSKGLDTDAIASGASALAQQGVYCRRGSFGLALAAGPAPMLGDLNVGDDLSAYARMSVVTKFEGRLSTKNEGRDGRADQNGRSSSTG